MSAGTLVDCPYCHGEGEIAYNPSWRNDPQMETSARCPTCHGDGTIEPRTWEITVCVLCLEHANDCQCDLDGWQGDEPPTFTITVGMGDQEIIYRDALTDIATAARDVIANQAVKWPMAFVTYAADVAEGALDVPASTRKRP